MAISITTTSALASISGTPGELYFNTDNNKFIIFNGTGTGSGNYTEFSDDGTLGASIALSFTDPGSAGAETVYGSGGMNYYDVSASDISGYYKRFDQHSDAIAAINAETQMFASGSSISEIPGNSATGMMSYLPYLYQADGANAPSATGGNGQVFVFTGSVLGGAITSNTAAWTDGMSSSGTWYYVPVIYLINEGYNTNGVTSPMWGMTLVVAEGSNLTFPSYTDPSQTNQEWGILNWGGNGTVIPGNNETTVRQALSGASVISSYGGNAAMWSLDTTYAP